jgi:hypothetical protein
MKRKDNLAPIISTILLALVLAASAVARPTLQDAPQVLLEIAHISCLTPDCSESYTTRIYTDGSVVVESNAITYHKEAQVKRVTVYNYLISNEAEKAKLPPSVLKIIEMASPIH